MKKSQFSNNLAGAFRRNLQSDPTAGEACRARREPGIRLHSVLFSALIGLSVLAAGVSAQTVNPNAVLLFKSGFENDVYLDPIYDGSYQIIRGKDQVSSYTWPISAFNPHPSLSGIQDVITSNQATYLGHAIQSMPGPSGQTTKALLLKLNAPATSQTCCIQASLQTAGLATPLREVYVRLWMKFNPELLDQARSNPGNFWRVAWEMKTFTDYRITPFIYADSSGTPYWLIQADNKPNGCSNCQTFWTIVNKNVPVPTDRWFLMEYYLYRSSGNDGRVFWAVDGQVIADRMGPNMGANNEEVNVIMYQNLYGSIFPMYEWLDDIEIWNKPPCTGLPCGAPAGGGGTSSVDTQAPSAPTGLAASVVSSSQISLSWSASTDNVGVAGYRIFRNGSSTPLATATTTSYQDTSVAASTSYSYTVTAFDSAGNTSSLSNSVTAATPAAAVSLVRGIMPTSGTTLYDPAFTTDGSPDAVQVAGAGSGPQWIQFDLGVSYVLNGAKLWHYPGDNRTYHDVIVQVSNTADFSSGVSTVYNNDRDNTTGLGAGADAEYPESASGMPISFSPVSARYVRLWVNGSTVNQWNHYSEVEVYGNSADITPPTVPANLTAKAASSSQINLSWTASTDASGVAGYRIYRNGGSTPIATAASTTYQDTNLSAGTTYSYRVAAVDASGNQSGLSSTASATTNSVITGDTQAPSVPSGLAASALSQSQLSLKWNASTDNVGVAGYRVFRNGDSTPIATVTTASYQDDDLAAETVYSYSVAAYDAAGNASAQSAAVSTMTPAAPPSLIKGKQPTSGTALYSPAYSTDGLLDAALVTGAGSGTQWVQYDLGQTYDVNGVKIWHYTGDDRSYRDVIVQVSNSADFTTAVTTVFNNDTDNSSGLGAGTQKEYSETAAGKHIPFNTVKARYVRFWVNGSSMNTWNHYEEVEIYGTGGGTDSTPPAAPTGLTAASVSTNQINLSWNAATDNVAVAGYRIYRNGSNTPVATVSGTTYQDTGLTASTTYTYTVAAFDAAGNASAQSSPVPATTQTAAQLSVSLTSPAANSTLAKGTNVLLQVAVGGTPANVVYRLDGAVIGTAGAAPWSYNWSVTSAASSGWHYIDAVATGSGGVSATSQRVKVKIR